MSVDRRSSAALLHPCCLRYVFSGDRDGKIAVFTLPGQARGRPNQMSRRTTVCVACTIRSRAGMAGCEYDTDIWISQMLGLTFRAFVQDDRRVE